MLETLPDDWLQALRDTIAQPFFAELTDTIERERREHTVYPAASDVFAALQHTSLGATRCVILGQDPYHGEGQAHGLSFSVQRGVKPPPSLRNIYKELQADLGLPTPEHGCLLAWARQGVLLLNTVLTVRDGQAHSHRKLGWERVTDAILQAVNGKRQRVVFLLWGRPAQKKRPLIDESRHTVLAAAHPSPLSARNGFFGCKPFSQVNAVLEEAGLATIDWSL